jgi:hypothetical protein
MAVCGCASARVRTQLRVRVCVCAARQYCHIQRLHSVFLRVKLSLIAIFLENQLCYRRSKTQEEESVLLQQFEFERLWAHVI